MIDRRPLYITRPPVGSLIAGGVDRLSAWLTRPWSHVRVETFCDADVVQWHHSARSPELSMRSFRKLDDRFAETIWDELVSGVFLGIDYGDWELPAWRENPDAAAIEEWIGQVMLETSLQPFDGAIRYSMAVTGAFVDEWSEGPEVQGVDQVVCWLQAPRFQALEDLDENDACPFTGRMPKRYWSSFGSRGLCRLSRSEVEALGWTPVAEGIVQALDGRNGVDRRWSSSFDLWVRITPAGVDDRDWSARNWF